MEEGQTARKSSLDVESDNSTDNPLNQQLEKNEDVKKRWQQLAQRLGEKQETLTEAIRLAEKHKEDKSKIEQGMNMATMTLDELEPQLSNPQVW